MYVRKQTHQVFSANTAMYFVLFNFLRHDTYYMYVQEKIETKLALTLSPILTALINGMPNTPQTVAVANASLSSCTMMTVDGWLSKL